MKFRDYRDEAFEEFCGMYAELEHLATELEGCPSKRTIRWMLERMEEDNEIDGEEWK